MLTLGNYQALLAICDKYTTIKTCTTELLECLPRQRTPHEPGGEGRVLERFYELVRALLQPRP